MQGDSLQRCTGSHRCQSSHSELRLQSVFSSGVVTFGKGLLQIGDKEWVPSSATHIASTTMFCVGGFVQLLVGMYELDLWRERSTCSDLNF
ncbi:hypothetical protein WJX77_001936 [Trebouxia sp. C0004]